ncbi:MULTISPECIES: hypothetical protein [unclassified Acinetobacter]|uniref:hypothetical protein n=1 Tax=unclassified Acinetobacter TaxID=196816 RepID=UPI0015D0D494|nr:MULTISPECIES: hypothetical protein [unclassified Acinetobacter]
MNSKLSKILGLGLFTSVISAGAFAEPPVQPGETLESLSKAKISTTVNGQQASLETLVNSGQVRLVDPRTAAPQQSMPNTQPAMPNDPSMMQAPGNSDMVSPQPPVAEPGMNQSDMPANLAEPANSTEVEATTSMAAPEQQPVLEEQQQAAVVEANAMNAQTEIAAQADAEPVLMEQPLNAAPEVPAAVELEQ